MIDVSEPTDFSTAYKRLQEKEAMPTGMNTTQIRREWPKELRQRALFSARTTKADILEGYRDQLGKMVEGKTNIATARSEMQRMLRASGYDPKSGFEGDEELDIPPAEEGSLRDLSSDRRVDLVLTTNVRQIRNAAYAKAGMDEDELWAWPAYELMRRRKGGLEPVDGQDWPSRWERVGGQFYGDGRMIAPKGSDIWTDLGSSANFDDALDTEVPPFAFGSGYGWQAVPRQECIDLGVITEDEAAEPGDGPGLNDGLEGAVEHAAEKFPPHVLREILDNLGAMSAALGKGK
jgi:hypothetical protein